LFIAPAHSLLQQTRLAVTLAWVAGYTNLITILTCATVTSHMSGAVSNLGYDLASGNWGHLWLPVVLIGCFFSGSLFSGICTEVGKRRAWESIYVLPMSMQAVLLFAFGLGLELTSGDPKEHPLVLALLCGLASFAMGLQNATITRISGGVVRTTHVTGVLTDLGIEAATVVLWLAGRRRSAAATGAWQGLRSALREHPSVRRGGLLLAIVSGFFVGAAMGTWMHLISAKFSMVPPVLLLSWIVLVDLIRPIAELHQAALISRRSDLPPEADSLAVYELRHKADRQGRLHHMPDLVAWAERLPESIQVVVLDFGRDAKLGREAIHDLLAVHRLFVASGRRLLVAGLDATLRRHLTDARRPRFEAIDLYEDVEMAVIHALARD
jgi:uncharacterized membrane protein YoaK (UPF0700 family)